MKYLNLTFGLIVFGLLVSCKAYRPVETGKPKIPVEARSVEFRPEQISRLKPLDELKITTKQEEVFFMQYHEASNDSLKGAFYVDKVKGEKVYEDSSIVFSNIKQIYRRSPSPALTTATVVGSTVAGLYAIALVAWFASPPSIGLY